MSTESKRERILLIDDDEQAGRTTASLAGSLATRLLTLHYTSGVSVVGSIIAGLAALGREAGRTVEGARLREALERGRGAANGEAVWSVMKIGDWAAGLPPSPILDHVRNDLALLLAEDLEEALEQPLAPPEARVRSQAPAIEKVTCVDCMLGLWAYSMEIVRAVEALAEPTLPPAGAVVRPAASGPEPEGSLLR